MRILLFTISTIFTIALIIALDRKWGSIPPMGKFLSPQQGFWQNAEPVDGLANESFVFKNLKGEVQVHLDDRLVPHVFAQHDEDAYFVQGYLHARYRLFQMELQTHFAAGRISEILGDNPQYIRFDREQRRMGMVYAAENALKEFEADTVTKKACDAYTAGVNAYISSLTESTIPLEYKLLDFRPEPWTNLKIALFLKQMSRTLADYGPDLHYTRSKNSFSFNELMQLDPQVPDSLVPIVPAGTAFSSPGLIPVPPATADSLYFNKKDSLQAEPYTEQDPNNGSNNWVVAGKKTQSGSPILANDPHLELTFPSIWYEMQITTPNINVYGVSFPGSPSIIIGFNDHIAWGVTNSQRDVKDFYEIRFQDESRKAYWFNGEWIPAQQRIEQIKVRGGADIYDTVSYTAFGPVIYDNDFSNHLSDNRAIAVRWAAHDPSNEGMTFYKLNRARNYDEYLDAIKHFSCPGQNFVFASKTGDIALWQQARFPARWYGQGMYLMPGFDSSYIWQGYIPQEENPHVFNPDTGFIQSANQRPVDSTYPYFIPGGYITARGISIANKLGTMQGITPEDMMRLQNDNHHVFAEDARHLLLKYVQDSLLGDDARKYLDLVKQWDLQASAGSPGTTVFQHWFDSLEKEVWADEWDRDSLKFAYPDEQTLMEWLAKDSAFRFIDNINTPHSESVYDLVNTALEKASKQLKELEKVHKLEWAKFKDPAIFHLLRDAVMPFARKIPAAGWSNVINATTRTHGPSWRMVVHLAEETEAYGVYPGGQSGNPGSKYYDQMVDQWLHGKHYRLWMMKQNEASDERVMATFKFSNS